MEGLQRTAFWGEEALHAPLQVLWRPVALATGALGLLRFELKAHPEEGQGHSDLGRRHTTLGPQADGATMIPEHLFASAWATGNTTARLTGADGRSAGTPSSSARRDAGHTRSRAALPSNQPSGLPAIPRGAPGPRGRPSRPCAPPAPPLQEGYMEATCPAAVGLVRWCRAVRELLAVAPRAVARCCDRPRSGALAALAPLRLAGVSSAALHGWSWERSGELGTPRKRSIGGGALDSGPKSGARVVRAHLPTPVPICG